MIASAREGDRDALATLWREHQPLILRYLRGRGVADPHDIASQVWIDVARNLPRFEGGADEFRRWLFTIARRRLIDELRRTGRRDRSLAAVRLAGDVAPGADEVFEGNDALVRALELVGRLPDKMRDAVLLRYVADLSVDDAAAVMGVRAGHVRVLTHRGLARLEVLLNEESGQVVTLPLPRTINPST